MSNLDLGHFICSLSDRHLGPYQGRYGSLGWPNTDSKKYSSTDHQTVCRSRNFKVVLQKYEIIKLI